MSQITEAWIVSASFFGTIFGIFIFIVFVVVAVETITGKTIGHWFDKSNQKSGEIQQEAE